jgi:DNA polymerase I
MLRHSSKIKGLRILWPQPLPLRIAWRELSVKASGVAVHSYTASVPPNAGLPARPTTPTPTFNVQIPPSARESFLRDAASPSPTVLPSHDESVEERRPAVTPGDIPGVTIVRDAQAAAHVIHQLTLARDSFIAWDTETTGVDPTAESPVDKGRVICMSAYGGDHLDFGNGPRLYVDCLDAEGGGEEMLQLFKAYFEDDELYKVWHNYSFDRHVLNNHGINVAGFGGDTMHMARLVDTSRKRYSLEELCNDYLDEGLRKATMKDRFGANRVLKDGSPGKDIVVPPTLELQRSAEHGRAWIEYAVSDAELTHRLMEVLSGELGRMEIAPGGNALPDLPYTNLRQLYDTLFVPFGNMLIDMERTGFKVDVDILLSAQGEAEKDRDRLENRFREWASVHCPDARYMNVNSGKQKQQLFFAPVKNAKTGDKMPREKDFVVEQVGIMGERYAAELVEAGAKAKAEAEAEASKENLEGDKGKPRKAKSTPKRPRSTKLKKTITLSGLGLPSSAITAGGWPSVNADTMRKLAGYPRRDPPMYGDAKDPTTCLAIDDIMESNSVSTLLSGFIVPLQTMVDAGGRIHASLNLNTETGRLSSRRPNLQNQPALEKDRYKIRNAFVCEPGNQLIVADYGQLELRLLAHITSCVSMIEAFAAGGDFHSRTALGMYDHVAEAVKRGDCLLEWDGEDGTTPTVPLLKDRFAMERRRAKTLNFSIAYGKTAVGLSRDWGISEDEARDTLKLWYKERQEVKRWQNECRRFAAKHKYVETLLGRRRHLPGVASDNFSERGHANRAAINAPLQGSAADLVMVAMLKLHRNVTLRALGWRVILQVHDEILCEGPRESAKIAREVIREVMLHPLDQPLRVAMTVEPTIAGSWFDAK